ncbi:MAG: SH3 domain-containing protein, partial [Prevotella bivia]|nr:SH3 domain-containing protein [Prevotella bivia]
SVVVKTAPDAAASKAFIIHEGTKVEILDKSMDQWWEVTLEDGRRGWIEKGLTEVI